MNTLTRLIMGGSVAVATILGGSASFAGPVKLTVGYGPASDVTLTLLKIAPQIAPNFGKAYVLDLQEFRGTDMRFRGYLSGALDGATGSSGAIIDAVDKGIGLVVVASISKESPKGFGTTYMVRDDSPIKSAADLKGKLLGINGHRSSIELWARLAVQGAGLDPDRDVRYAVVEFALQGQALRSKQLDVGAFTQPYAAMEQAKGGLRTLFTTSDILPWDQENQLLFFKQEVLQKSPDAVRALLSDLAAATRFYINQPDEARRLLIREKIIRTPEDIYLSMKDNYRAPNLEVNLQSLDRIQDIQIKAGFQRKKVDLQKLVDLDYLPK